ncbi:small acid-soluble spore protein K [Texcoconibacillus texcoconensis]|uniref:SASP K n=1 Tax=Texcoconibacillus texcoconensis TaxID=1095777 RepID=A0A840QSY0_9BACI|nr:small acid-soluble spore protein K [Texcoconibacillus texcoconensis]MBB5174632.1 hypothetical protein [Texcoconibacillus texcoconensis]
MRNKAKDFPENMAIEHEHHAAGDNSSQRVNGQIKDRPQERMRQAGKERPDPHQ